MRKAKIFFNRLTEATPSCLLTMVQGDITAITVAHWIKALEVGSLTGLIALIFTLTHHPELEKNEYVIAGITGFITSIADYMLHPSHFGGPTSEAIVTGIGAGLLCLTLSKLKGKR
jgi:hypothetical protein